MRNLQLISAWKATKTKNTYVNYHSHKYYELVYYLSGNGKTEIDGKVFHFSDNSFAIIPGNTEHDEFHYSDSEVICLIFSGIKDFQLGFFEDYSHTISKILNELLYEANKQTYGYKEMLVIKLNELILNIIRIENTIIDTKNFEYIINYIRENFHEHINLSDCAKQLNISYDYFQHKFKALTGYSPQHFLMERRLLASKKMLKKEAYNCTEIACRCGFCTSSQFSAMFKKRYSITPMQFKKQHQKA
ncbi:MAG: helix-turn-helix domain-containing protein [Ruminococcaceae bacterium]|nr:helix-turn-helix domain-containing protein [Oscillospiraceae bacterium]